MLTLVIGGARSGKSRFAQTLGCEARMPVYIATSRAEDAEMEARIARHRAARPSQWITVEAPLAIADAVAAAVEADFVLLDCLTVWLSNFCWERRGNPESEIETAALAEVVRLGAAAANLVVVTNEVGCGLVPDSALGRFFRDLQGWVNQEAARSADRVYHVVAGIPTLIKGGRA
jgi:adenosylcobinamide kinase/adenosylcobinamide-phosphate guanylyltransferase